VYGTESKDGTHTFIYYRLLAEIILFYVDIIQIYFQLSRNKTANKKTAEENLEGVNSLKFKFAAYNPAIFTAVGIKHRNYESCAVCNSNYLHKSNILQFGCQARHYFHLQCAKLWFEYTLECPVCETKKEDMSFEDEPNRDKVKTL